MKWTNSLKVAIIEENTQAIADLMANVPKFDNLDRAKEALSLMKVAIEFIDKKRENARIAMKKIKQTKEFLNY